MIFIQSLVFRSKKIIWFLLWNFLWVSNSAFAAYQIDKIRMVLSQQQPVDTLKVSNSGTDTAINLQFQIFRWTQNNGNDVYQNTKDLIVAPPIARIPIGKTQVTRVGWRTPMPVTQELAYRLLINDLTAYNQPKNSVLIKLKVNMPIFIEPDHPVIQAQWKLKRVSGNKINVLVTNTGNEHIEVTKLTLINANNEVIASQPTQFYLLPNQSKQGVLIANKLSGSKVTVSADTDNGVLTATVDVL